MKLVLLNCMTFLGSLVYGQTRISALVGASKIVIHQNNLDLQRGGYAYQIGLQSESRITQKQFFFQTGILYQVRLITDYINEPFSFDIQKYISVRTNLVQHNLEVPIYLKYRFKKSRVSIGTGLEIWFLLKQKMNQDLTETLNFDSSTNARLIYNYKISDNQIHLSNRFNLAPVIYLGILLTKNIELGLNFSYSIINPSQVYLNYNKFNQITNTLSLSYNLN